MSAKEVISYASNTTHNIRWIMDSLLIILSYHYLFTVLKIAYLKIKGLVFSCISSLIYDEMLRSDRVCELRPRHKTVKHLYSSFSPDDCIIKASEFFFYIKVLYPLLTLVGVLAGLLGISCHKCAYHMLEESRLEVVPHPSCQAPVFAPESGQKWTSLWHGACFLTHELEPRAYCKELRDRCLDSSWLTWF